MTNKKSDQTISAEQADDAKPWRLPFWTEPPSWVIEKEKQENEVVEEEVETFPMPTAEELENIRRDAYNAGLEQGLIEGRQQGHSEGYDAGKQKGLAEGRLKGEEEGRQQGFASGEAQGLEQGQQQINDSCQQLSHIYQYLKASVVERDQQLPQLLADMVVSLSEQVVQHELSQGSEKIAHFIHQSLLQLPGGEKDIHIFISPVDMNQIDQARFDGDKIIFNTDSDLAPGDCRVQTDRSLVEYSASEHLNQLLSDFIPQLLREADKIPLEEQEFILPEKSVEEGDAEASVESAAAEIALDKTESSVELTDSSNDESLSDDSLSPDNQSSDQSPPHVE